jgi:small basic protein
LFISAGSILVFYLIDVSHLMSDKEMNGYWSYRMISGGSGARFVALRIWEFFAQVGAGLVFEIIFGLTGIAAFAWGLYSTGVNLLYDKYNMGKSLRLYTILLILLSLLLFFCGKLPIEHKFNAYTVPSISILVIFLLDKLFTISSAKKITGWLTAVLVAGLVGNIITTAATPFLSSDYALRMNIYVATENAILQAQARNLPIIVTPGVALPDSITITTRNLTSISASSVLKTFPAYKVKDNLKVYALNNLGELKDYMKKLPAYTTSVIAGDGTSFQVVTR